MKMISRRRGGFLRGWITLFLVLALIAMVCGWFIARTDGFRDLVAQRLSSQWGLPVEIEQSYIGWPYVLVLRGVSVEGNEAVRLHVRTLRLGRGLRRWHLSARGARVVFKAALEEDNAHTFPAVLVRIAQMRDAGALELMRATQFLQDNWHISLRDVDLFWEDEEGHIVGAVRQLLFKMEAVQLPSRELIYYRLSYPGQAEAVFGGKRDLDWEWMTSGDDYIELHRGGVAPDWDTCE